MKQYCVPAKIGYGVVPDVLVLGNGINRCFGELDWEELLRRKQYRECEQRRLKNMPYPLRAVVETSDCVDKAVESLSDRLCSGVIEREQKELLGLYLGMDYDAILTTNYSYEAEKALCMEFSCKRGTRNKYRKSTRTGNTLDERLGLYKYNAIEYGGVVKDIWHIHGEGARPNSMVLGHYYYGKLTARIENYIGEFMRRYMFCQTKKLDFQPYSWIDYFMLGNIYMVGIGMDLSEIDLWWLINCKKNFNQKYGTGAIKWYEPNLERLDGFCKKEVAKAYGIHIKTKRVKGANGYKAYYEKLVGTVKRDMEE